MQNLKRESEQNMFGLLKLILQSFTFSLIEGFAQFKMNRNIKRLHIRKGDQWKQSKANQTLSKLQSKD